MGKNKYIHIELLCLYLFTYIYTHLVSVGKSGSMNWKKKLKLSWTEPQSGFFVVVVALDFA